MVDWARIRCALYGHCWSLYDTGDKRFERCLDCGKEVAPKSTDRHVMIITEDDDAGPE